MPKRKNPDSGEASNANLKYTRKDFLDEEDYFMAVAYLTAKRSKDIVTQVGACIVNKAKEIVGIGYNKMPNGVPDKYFCNSKYDLNRKLLYVSHAELNAITNKFSADVKGCTMYTTLYPCNECAKLIIQSGITEVVYASNKSEKKDPFKASKILLEEAGIKIRAHEPTEAIIELDLNFDK